ncbi:MAG TPA: thiamine phosphate synthase [Acidimicrobiales bacterium]|nr:thiamine phosphate synthase [Acidimicrobiales bacterium]
MTWSLRDRSLYLCTPVRGDIESFVAECVAGGVDVVQLRDKDHDDRAILEAATRLAGRCADLGVPFIVNDRPDIAYAVGADGVHVGQDDVTVELCRSVLGDEAIVGLSTHSPAQLDAALDARVSYLSAGPVEATPTKPGREGTGAEYAALASRRAQVPVFATGGVTTATIPGLAALGVRHFVVVRALTTAADPRRAAAALASAIRDSVPPASSS